MIMVDPIWGMGTRLASLEPVWDCVKNKLKKYF